MKIIYYCQHVLGMGHFFRSLEICKALAGQEVILVTGGSPVSVQLPAHVRGIHLPELMMDQAFSILYSPAEDKTVAGAMQERQRLLFRLFAAEAPDLFVLELYPFGRKAFRVEIDPILEGIRSGSLPRSRVVCSLRDVLVEKKDPATYEARVVAVLNRYFDALLVHADPRVLKLDQTFSRLKDITVPIVYTGFVTPKPAPDAGSALRRQLGIDREAVLIVASAGGGTVGNRLLEAVVKAFPLMEIGKNSTLHLFTGPFLGDDEYERLRRTSGRRVRIARFTPDFLSYLAAADLSVSMAGYNTCMNIAAAQIPSLVWPFPQNREQGLRAARLAQLGILQVLSDEDLRPQHLSARMEQALSRRSRTSADIDLTGAESTARWLLETRDVSEKG
jgi:predicted glycosyltransferase